MNSTYVYNALGARIENVQVRKNENAGHANAALDSGSRYARDYTAALSDNRAAWQRVWETEAGTVVQNDFETVTKHYVVDYLSSANRDIFVTEEGSVTWRNGTTIIAYGSSEWSRCVESIYRMAYSCTSIQINTKCATETRKNTHPGQFESGRHHQKQKARVSVLFLFGGRGFAAIPIKKTGRECQSPPGPAP